MSCNLTLAALRGVSNEDIKQIDKTHLQLEKLLLLAHTTNSEEFNNKNLEYIKQLEYTLQDLWGFGRNSDRYTWCNEYLFKCQWVGRVFECESTGEQHTITHNIKEKEFITIGDGCIDLGVLNGYYRRSGVKEVVNNINK